VSAAICCAAARLARAFALSFASLAAYAASVSAMMAASPFPVVAPLAVAVAVVSGGAGGCVLRLQVQSVPNVSHSPSIE
jgi:ribose/xylose/arabinose/galactoside ABC-type transport system permease subunit